MLFSLSTHPRMLVDVLALLTLCFVYVTAQPTTNRLQFSVGVDDRCRLLATVHATQTNRLLRNDTHVLVHQRRRGYITGVAQVDAKSGIYDRNTTPLVYVELYSRNESAIRRKFESMCKISFDSAYQYYVNYTASVAMEADHAADDIVKIVDNGPQTNRIDMVLLGDGYTAGEHKKFNADMHRIASELLSSSTFQSLFPLINVWTIFTASKESGVGTGGKAKDTPYKLYRDGTELRGVYTSNPEAARQACARIGTAGCDYPAIIGNDDYYGGLGGEFVISTSSPTSGVVVIRHEMTHNFIPVGEEYDGGYVYTGPNSARNLNAVRKTWSQWLNQTTKLRAEKASPRIQEYPWLVLNDQIPFYSIGFKSDGKWSRWMMELTISGFPNDDDIEVLVDNEALEWKSRGVLDRTFYRWFSPNSGFSSGDHTVTIKLKSSIAHQATNETKTIPKQVCSISLIEYADEDEYRFTFWPQTNTSSLFVVNGELPEKLPQEPYYSAYPTWDINKRLSYRPTNEMCLMRNMHSDQLCAVCLEGMWLNFLSRVNLIDGLSVTPVSPTQTYGRTKRYNIILTLLPIAHRRRPGSKGPVGEHYQIDWFRNNVKIPAWHDKEEIPNYELPANDGNNDLYTVRVVYKTPDIRRDVNGLTKSERSWRFSQLTGTDNILQL